MFRMLKIALCSATMMVTACKKTDPAETKPAEPTKVDPAKPADPAAKPADPTAKPADPAAKGDPAKPAGGGQNTELETKGIAMMEQMGDLFAGNAKDCDKLATGIKGFIAQNKPLIDQLSALDKSQSEAEKKAFAERNVAVQEEVMKKMEPAMKACSENANVQAAMKEFPAD